MKILLSFIVLLGMSSFAKASDAEVHVVDTFHDNHSLIISFEEGGLQLSNDDNQAYDVSIKGFGDDNSQFQENCYSGTVEATKVILKALVDNANGDGDSW